MNKKSITILVVCLIVSVMSVSLAFFSARIIGNGKNVSVNAKELTINFDNNNEIASGIIEPGWSSANTFSVTNKSKTTFTYDIVLKNYKNTTKTNGYLVYKITSTNGYNMTEFKDMPKDGENTYDLVIARGITIEPGSSNKQNYTLEIKYLDSTEDQSIDMGSTVTGSLYIVESTTNENNPYTKGTLGYQIMEDNSNIKTRTDFSKVYTDTNIGTMYKAQEDNTDVYYFAGDARNNWVKFGGYYWRIIRTNHDGSVRLLYAGTSPDTTEAYIGKSSFNETYEDPMYAGYMYGTSGSLDLNRTNENNSTIKTYIDNWYNNNLSSYTKYLSTEAVYCNDREVKKGNYSLSGTMFEFGSSIRIDTNNQPTYDCANKKDAFSGSNTEAKLLYPIALMTADEVTYAGGRHNGCIDGGVEGLLTTWYSLNSKKESATGTTWWFLLSPAVADSKAYNFHMYHEGCLGVYSSVGNIWGVRPVISLKSDVVYKLGDGSASKPYEVEDMPDTLSERLLSDKSTRPSGPRGTGFDKVYTENNTKTLYTSTEDSKTVYYFAGNATDNWVKFGKNESNQDLYWRIIRTNSDGGVRLLYHGTSTTATDAYIGTSKFNTTYNDPKYVGYMYGTSGSLVNNRTNTNSSTIKGVIDVWYKNNLNTNYGKYISTTAAYCNDRNVIDGTYNTSSFSYAGRTRLYTNKAPTYNCLTTEDKFTITGNIGNGKLTYPIALMTADEISYAGGVYDKNSLAWYYYNSVKSSSTGSINWWLISPFNWYGNTAYTFLVYGSNPSGVLGNSYVNNTLGVRPVISLKADVVYKSGDGTATSPYEIVTD